MPQKQRSGPPREAGAPRSTMRMSATSLSTSPAGALRATWMLTSSGSQTAMLARPSVTAMRTHTTASPGMRYGTSVPLREVSG